MLSRVSVRRNISNHILNGIVDSETAGADVDTPPKQGTQMAEASSLSQGNGSLGGQLLRHPKASRQLQAFGLGALAATLLFLISLQVYSATHSETIEILRLPADANDVLINATEPAKLSTRLVLRNLVEEMAVLHGELRQTSAAAHQQQEEEQQAMVKRLVDVKEASKHQAELLTKQVEGLKQVVEQQQQQMRDQSVAITRLESQVEIAKATAPRLKDYALYVITDDSPDSWQQRTFRRYGAYGFVKFSAYRTSRSKVVILGLAALGLREKRRMTSCHWHQRGAAGGEGEGEGEGEEASQGQEGGGGNGVQKEGVTEKNGGVINGELEMLYMEEHHNYLYEVVVLNCNLEADIQSSGGFLEVRMDSEISFPYREDPGEHLDPYSAPLPYNLLYCGPPMYGEIEARVVREWVDYHRAYMGADHFIFYDAGAVSHEVMSALKPYLVSGMLSLTNFREANQWDSWLWAQGLAIQDCLYRSRPLAKWAFFHDFDEFLVVMPPQSLPELLKKYEDKSWLTHGCVVFGIHECVNPDEEEKKQNKNWMLVERFQFRWPHIYCQRKDVENKNLCIDQWGHRKYIVNPRKVSLLQIHVAKVFEGEGVDLSVEEARHSHFQGLAKRGQVVCDKGEPKEWWLRSTNVAKIASVVKKCPFKLRKANECTPQEIARRSREESTSILDTVEADSSNEEAEEGDQN